MSVDDDRTTVDSSEALSFLANMRVQRVDAPAKDCLSLTFYERGDKFSLVLLFGRGLRGFGLRRERPKGDAASPFVRRLRTQIEGARFERAEWLGLETRDEVELARALRFTFRRGEHVARIVVDFDGQLPNLFLLRDDDTTAGASDERARRTRFPQKDAHYTPSAARGIPRIDGRDQLFEVGSTLLAERSERREEGQRAQARTQARAQLKKVKRRIDAIREDLARADAAPRLRREGQLLLMYMGTIPRGATQVELRDETVDPPELVSLKLDPAKGARELAEQRFDRARRAERGVSIASTRLREAEVEAAELESRIARLENEPIEEVLGSSAAEALAPLRNKPKPRVPFRTFRAANGHAIFVGKGAADNDTLTLTVARPHDHWMHVRGVPGSHVVVPLERKAIITQELLLDAAHLAAHFSKQRGEPVVEIAHTERRFVRKLKGSLPGSVNLDRERVFVLRIEADRLTRLLASETT